jgi:hypothetical protein
MNEESLPHWDAYVKWCGQHRLRPLFDAYLIWLDDNGYHYE